MNQLLSFQRTTIWYRCLVCHKFFQFPKLLLAHRAESECRFEYKGIIKERSKNTPTVNFKRIKLEPSLSTDFQTIDEVNNLDKQPENEFIPRRESFNKLKIPPPDLSIKTEIITNSHSSDGVDNKSKNEVTKKAFDCYFCSSTTTTMSSLSHHIQIHTRERPYPCQACNNWFTRVSYLKTHISKAHQDVKPIEFKRSGDRFSEACGLKRHSSSSWLPLKSTSFQNSRAITKIAQPSNIKYSGSVAGISKNVSSKMEIMPNSHSSMHLDRKRKLGPKKQVFQCYFCNSTKRDFSDLILHMHTHTKETPYPCHTCCKSFTCSSNLNKHISRVHEDIKPNECKLCGNFFSYPNKLKEHSTGCLRLPSTSFQNGHAIGKSTYSGSVAATSKNNSSKTEIITNSHRSNYANHKRKRGFKNNIFKCYFCPSTTKSMANMYAHILTHTKEKPNRCTFCGKSFSQSGSLNVHISRVHEGHRPYVCKVCGSPFSRQQDLKRHSTKCTKCLRLP